MTYATIYEMDGHVATDGVQSGRVCDAAVQMAKRMAADRRRSVIVEDRGTEECYRVTPGGHVWRAPKGWTPSWEADADC